MAENLPKRKTPRLSKFDYSTPGTYFITICTKDKKQILSDIVGAIRESPLRSSTISTMVGFLKMTSSKEIHRQFCHTEIWQRSFHDHIIRGRQDYAQIARYITENPQRWTDDCF